MTELGGTPVRDAADLQIRLALLRTGEVAEFAVSRAGGTLTVRAEMAEREPAALEMMRVASESLVRLRNAAYFASRPAIFTASAQS